jgi:hypothetical protein
VIARSVLAGIIIKASVTMFPCPTEILSLIAFLLEDACIGGVMNSCLSLLDFMLKSLSGLPSLHLLVEVLLL